MVPLIESNRIEAPILIDQGKKEGHRTEELWYGTLFIYLSSQVIIFSMLLQFCLILVNKAYLL